MFGKNLKNVFSKKKYEFREVFSEFIKSLTLIVDMEQLKDNVISKMRETVKVDEILIFLFNPDLNRFELVEVRGLNKINSGQLYFFPDDPLLRWFSVNETYLHISENPAVFSYFDEREQSILKEIHCELIFPLLVMNRVNGLICLGLKW